ncbi:hypothetical protein [Prevotella histicola]
MVFSIKTLSVVHLPSLWLRMSNATPVTIDLNGQKMKYTYNALVR